MLPLLLFIQRGPPLGSIPKSPHCHRLALACYWLRLNAVLSLFGISFSFRVVKNFSPMPRASQHQRFARTGLETSLPAAAVLHRLWSGLCSTIGERRAGSAGDRVAADFVLNQFRSCGLAARAEQFLCTSVIKAKTEIALGTRSNLRNIPARVLAGSPSTRGTRPIEAELVWVEMPEQAQRLLQPSLRGKVVVLFGPMPTRADLHRRLVACRPAAVIHVDDRLPFEWVKDDGIYPAWARRYGMPPTVTIPYRTAWDLRKSGADRARVRVSVELKQRPSNNLVAEIPGRRTHLPLILLGAHHDTQCNNTGADDNASGVVALIALANLAAGPCVPSGLFPSERRNSCRSVQPSTREFIAAKWPASVPCSIWTAWRLLWDTTG
jgi:hypothetical protein